MEKQTIYRKDYRKPDFALPEVALHFDMREDCVLVTTELTLDFVSEGDSQDAPLALNAEDMKILSLVLDGKTLSEEDYTYENSLLTLRGLKENSKLVTKVEIDPYNNTQLMGLYKSGSTICSQCEAEGFRRITPFLDHPDVMSRFTTTIEGSDPVLLSNGNLIEETTLEGGRRRVVWQDPFPKPCYLFALVAGDLGRIEDSFTTMSGREVVLQIFTDKGNEHLAHHAMDSLKMAMKWDEEVYGLEYDLDLFMIVAVDAFNFGAMENKGLNIFNSKAVLADSKITTDDGMDRISAIVAHEYFHNWTGNRVTCRDWFQLTLKEGLTVFRDHSFSEDTTSAGLCRVDQVRGLMQAQFPEDRGPNSHPIRPESYREIDNFYSSTVYEKGAEVIRMIHTLLGAEGFRKGIDEYFKRHDGQGVTCEDFVAAMEAGGSADLTQFRRWYSQAGTPQVKAETKWADGIFTIKVSQNTPQSADGSPKEPFYFPINMALFKGDGSLEDEEMLIISEEEQIFTIYDLEEEPRCSLLRKFSSPIILEYDQSEEDLFFLLAHETDPYSRYTAAQKLFKGILAGEFEQKGSSTARIESLCKALGLQLASENRDNHFMSLLLTLPTTDEIADLMEYPDFALAYELRVSLAKSIGQTLESEMVALYHGLAPAAYEFTREQVGNRALRGALLSYLVRADETRVELALEQYRASDNMTDSASALSVLCAHQSKQKDEALAHYYDTWKDQFLPLTNWFAYQSSAAGDHAYEDTIALAAHEKFNLANPNMVRALYGGFTRNRPQFHHPSGRGYRLIAEKIIELDKVNRGIAAALAKAFLRYGQLGPELKEKMKEALESILAIKDLSAGVYEVVEKTLGNG